MVEKNFSELTDITCHSFVGLIRKRAFVSIALKDKTLRSSYNKTKAAHGFLHIVYVLYADLIVDTISLLADQSPDTASLSNVMDEIEKKRTYDSLQKEYVRPHAMNWLNKFDNDADRIELENYLQKRETKQLAAEFRKLYNASIESWEKLQARAEFTKLRRIRNKILSHKATKVDNGALRLFTLQEFKATYSDCDQLIDAAQPILVNVGSLVRKTDYGYRSAQDIYQREAQEFWATCRGALKA